MGMVTPSQCISTGGLGDFRRHPRSIDCDMDDSYGDCIDLSEDNATMFFADDM